MMSSGFVLGYSEGYPVLLSGRIVLVLLLAGLAAAPLPAGDQLAIRVEATGWGDAEPDDVRKVLESAGSELLRRVPPPRTIRVRVVPADDSPQVDFRRAEDGEYTVRLAVKNRQWSQFAFQFAHELGHIVSNYERRDDNKIGNENQWFEEAVGEAASLFVLKRMAETWKTNPPYANWIDYAPSLADYAAERVRDIEAPDSDRMPAWLRQHRAALRADPYLRDRNRVVAVHLAAMLERNPEHWEAIRYLNLGRPDPANSFDSYLENWYFSVPRAQKPFVKGIADLLGVKSEWIADRAVE